MKKYIYLVVGIPTIQKRGDINQTENPRSFGYYFSRKEANNAIVNNIGGIDEAGYYDYACVERVVPGIHGTSKIMNFYKWNTDKSKYEPCENPYTSLGIVSIGGVG